MKTLLDRRDTSHIKTLDRMIVELSKYMSDYEIDRCVDFINTISTSKFDINPTVEDAAGQMRIILGEQRYYEIKAKWSSDNQHLIAKHDNKTKYVCKKTGTVYCGLDPHDDPHQFTVIKM